MVLLHCLHHRQNAAVQRSHSYHQGLHMVWCRSGFANRPLHGLVVGCCTCLVWCRDLVPWQQRAGNLAVLVRGVGYCMATRYTNFQEQLWRVAVHTFNAIVELGLPAVNISYVNDEEPPGPQVWAALAQAFEW